MLTGINIIAIYLDFLGTGRDEGVLIVRNKKKSLNLFLHFAITFFLF